jgi:hypothetical protein
LLANFSFGQTLQKGNLLGLHVMTINLKPNVTMDDFKTFFINKVIPEYEKQFQPKGYLVKCVRGESENSFGVVGFLNLKKQETNILLTMEDPLI